MHILISNSASGDSRFSDRGRRCPRDGETLRGATDRVRAPSTLKKVLGLFILHCTWAKPSSWAPMGRAQKRAPDLRNLVNRSSNTLAYQTTTHGDHSIKGVRMSGWQSRTAREAKNRQQEFQAANLAQRVQTDHRLRHEATWEASSRYKAQAASAQRGQTQHDCSAEEALQQRRQCLAAKLAQETEQLRQQLGQPPLALAAARRQDMLDQARARASARDARRAQVRTFETARMIATSSCTAFTDEGAMSRISRHHNRHQMQC